MSDRSRPRTSATSCERSRERSGISLTEVLVSVAIIAVLTALIAFAVLRGKSSAREVACLQNLRQIGVAVESYATDFDDSFIPYGTHYRNSLLTGESEDTAEEQADKWVNTLQNYGITFQQCFCPDDPHTNPGVAKSKTPQRPLDSDAGGVARLATSYRVTVAIYFPVIRYARSAVASPSQSPYLIDGFVKYKENAPFYNHEARFNALHVDGSVKSYSNTHQFPAVVPAGDSP